MPNEIFVDIYKCDVLRDLLRVIYVEGENYKKQFVQILK